MSLRSGLTFLVSALVAATALAWDYEGHRIVNEVALASLPADFPAGVREAVRAERIAWLCSEADRWRASPDLPIRHANGMDHYLDMEELDEAGLSLASLSAFRYDFALQFAAGRAAHPEAFPPLDPEKDPEHTRIWPGFLPWTITEYYGKLRADFAILKVYQELGMRTETAQVEASIAEVMGTMGHFVGDAAQPLHTTIHHNGWFGPNPNGYTTWRGFHAWIDGGFIRKADITFASVRNRVVPATRLEPGAAAAGGRDPMFGLVLDYVKAQHGFMEKTYQIEKDGRFNRDERPADPVGVAFIDDRLLTGGQMLGRLWLTAWLDTPPDKYLRGQLLKRQSAGTSQK